MPLLSEDDFNAYGCLYLGKPKPTNTPEPSTPLPASLQQLADELVGDANRTRIIISGRRVGRSAVMAEIAKRMRSDPALRKVFLGGATVPCPWEREGRETFYLAAKNEYHGLGCAVIQRASKRAADAVARQARRQAEIDADALRQATQDMVKEKEPKKPLVDLKPRHEVDRERIFDLLNAMACCNADDKAIPEEWMDELSDLVWRERDRLEANTED